jgi:endoglucanase
MVVECAKWANPNGLRSGASPGPWNSLMRWLDGKSASYLAWAWDTHSCSSFPGLITSYNGTPTNYGKGYRAHLLSLR